MILVTGAGGQLGTEILKQSKKFTFKSIFADKKKLDISDQNKIKSFIKKNKIKIIINTAAFTKVDLSEKKKKLCMNINYNSVKKIVNICKKNNILLIQISTDYVFYGKSKNSYTERSKENPKNLYGLSKFYADKFITKNLDKYIIIRSGWIFSRNSNNFINFIKTNIDQQKKMNLIHNQFGNPTSARSLSMIILQFSEKYLNENYLKYGTYNFCNFPSTNWYNFGKFYIRNVLKLKNLKINKISWKKLNLLAKRPLSTKLNCNKISKYLKIKKIYWKDELFKL